MSSVKQSVQRGSDSWLSRVVENKTRMTRHDTTRHRRALHHVHTLTSLFLKDIVRACEFFEPQTSRMTLQFGSRSTNNHNFHHGKSRCFFLFHRNTLFFMMTVKWIFVIQGRLDVCHASILGLHKITKGMGYTSCFVEFKVRDIWHWGNDVDRFVYSFNHFRTSQSR